MTRVKFEESFQHQETFTDTSLWLQSINYTGTLDIGVTFSTDVDTDWGEITIYYTIDGTEPSSSNGEELSGSRRSYHADSGTTHRRTLL